MKTNNIKVSVVSPVYRGEEMMCGVTSIGGKRC